MATVAMAKRLANLATIMIYEEKREKKKM